MSTYRTGTLLGVVALVGILPGAIAAAGYLLVLTGQLYHHWEPRTALVLGMAAWGVVGVVTLWHEYVRLARSSVAVERAPVSPRVVLFAWALLLLAFASWKADPHPWLAAFLALAALYSFGRAFGLLRYGTRPAAAARRAGRARSPRNARARETSDPRRGLRTGVVRSTKSAKIL